MAENTTAAPAADAAAPAAPAPGSTGLLENVTPVAPDATPKDPNASDLPHLADDPGAKTAAAVAKGERPPYVPEKFWDAEKGEMKSEAAMKSYAELEKNFKLGNHKPPANGKYETAALVDKGIPADDPLLGKYTAWASKYGVSQAAFDELAGDVAEMAGGAVQEAQISAKAEREALGEQADAIIGSMTDWARGLVSSGVWTAEDFEEFKVMGGTAKGMRALMRMRESYEGRVPLRDTIPSDIGMSDEELKAMVGDKRYATNEGGFRDKVERLFEQRWGGGRAAA
jgi:hypothetical protein